MAYMNTATVYVTGFAKTVLIGTATEINYSLILKLDSSTVQAHQAYMDIDSQVCFHRWLFSNLSNHEGALQDLWSQ